ncbi:MAG: radical SAM protein [bacterium]|nr:radical SAM protein [bacterium]
MPINVLIINPSIRLADKPRNIPHGLAILVNIITKKLNIEVTFLDINAYRYNEKQVQEIIQKTNFDIVLIGGLAPTYGSIIKLSKLIKHENPHAKIIAGGYVVMSMIDTLLKNSEVDIVCTGEGEITIIKLLDKFQKKGINTNIDDILGICYKDNNQVIYNAQQSFIKNLDIDSMLPAYEKLPMEIYLSNPCAGIGRDIDMITIRGCPYRCTFCYQPWGHKHRAHSVDFIIKAIRHLRVKYNIDFVSFQDDEFMTDLKRVYEFCKKRNQFCPDLLWSCTGRANIVARNEELVKFMKDSGCVLISFGFESASQRMLNSMRKKQTIEEMEKTVKICRKYNLPIPTSFIIGMPGEDDESSNETLNFCIKNNLPLDSLMFATPYPGTEIFNFAILTKRINKNNLHKFMLNIGDARDFFINLTDFFSNDQLIQKREEMMRISRENYEKFITIDGIMEKMKNLYGNLLDKVKLDKKDLEHRAKHGGIGVF